jgi:glycosyltransferase involved in cell wall biosynthesis
MRNPKMLFLTTSANRDHLELIYSLGKMDTVRIYKVKKSQNILSGIIGLMQGVLEVPNGYDVIICETNYYYPAIKKMLGLLDRKTKIIDMNVGPAIYLASKKRLGFYGSILLYLLRYVDGYVSFGTFGKEMLEELGERKPCVIFYCPFQDSQAAMFYPVKPNLDSREMAIIVRQDSYGKGLDLAIKALGIVNKKYPDAKLHVIGKFEPDKRVEALARQNPNAIIHGYVNDFCPILERCSLYVHPARVETFGRAVFETMAAGLIPVISSGTGMKEFVYQLDKRNVLPEDPEAFAKRIIELFETSRSEKEKVSGDARRLSKFFDQDFLRKFRKDFYAMMDGI